MIYWINGPYGVGKSTVAEALQKMLPKAHIFDAEEVGNAITIISRRKANTASFSKAILFGEKRTISC